MCDSLLVDRSGTEDGLLSCRSRVNALIFRVQVQKVERRVTQACFRLSGIIAPGHVNVRRAGIETSSMYRK